MTKQKLKYINISIYISALILAVFFSLYSISNNSWVWENGYIYQRILGTTSGLAAFTGVIATIKFYKRDRSAYIYSILNGLLFGSFALSIDLTGDFIVNIIWYIPIMIFFYIKIKNGNKINVYRLTFWKAIFFINLFILSFCFFFFLNPLLNTEWGKLINFNVTYGSYFRFYEFGRVLDSVMNTVSIVAIIMMILGMKEAWYVWIPKNIAGLIFYSGVGILNISVIAMNFIYLLITIYIISKNIKNKDLRVAIVGPGAVGKSTIIINMQDFLYKNNFKILNEREKIIDPDFDKYMKNMKLYAFGMQKKFFSYRIDEIKAMQLECRSIIDRHLIDDFIFPNVHIKLGNFSESQSIQWKKIEKSYWRKLNNMPKLDILFIIRADDKIIEFRRNKRSNEEKYREHEIINTVFFKEVNKEYHSNDSIMLKAAKKFSKKTVIYENNDSEVTANKIKEEIARKIKV